nr:hypothetical protein [Rhodococcus wratislaviensis]
MKRALTTIATTSDTHGMPYRFTLARPFGAYLSMPNANDARAALPRVTQPLPAGEMAASISRTVAKAPNPAAPRAWNSGADAQSLVRRPAQSPTEIPASDQSSAPRKPICRPMYTTIGMRMDSTIAKGMSRLGFRASPP